MAFFDSSQTDESWLLMCFEDSKFDIIKRSRVFCEKEEDIFLGATIRIKCGKVKMRGTVVSINDSKKYIEENLEEMRENHLKNISRKSSKRKTLCTELQLPNSRDDEVQHDLAAEMTSTEKELLMWKNRLAKEEARNAYYREHLNFIGIQISKAPNKVQKPPAAHN
ncbi:PREDICTED: uncharacterized protein LOC108559316 [Nicrophorus vespilloides]|uniref:Uncharacterized protein LOC108559316 n=1 Tax=Nicrophorus vespilloides TaxID=110193 RepID=A0ABM1MBU6_NICVS|nr:PREDICTED: uncharacterized protein LOC108559316 [Nicrophorus vespilloides]